MFLLSIILQISKFILKKAALHFEIVADLVEC